MTRYRSKHHPDNGVTYVVVGDTLYGDNGVEFRAGYWDWSDLEQIEDGEAE